MSYKSVWSILLFISVNVSAQSIQITRPVAGVASSTNGNNYSIASFTPTPRSLLVLIVAASGTVLPDPVVNTSGLVLDWILEDVSIVNGDGYYIFWAEVGTTSAPVTITFNCTGDNATGARLSVHEITGYDRNRENPFKQTFISSSATSSNSPTINFNEPLLPANGYILGWSGNANTVASNPPSNWIESDDVSHNAPNAKLSTARKEGGETTVGPFSFSNNNSISWIVFGIEIYVYYKGIPLFMLRN